MPEGWEWDDTLFLGSAPYYAQGRLPYATALPDELGRATKLDGRGRLLDVGCGPGIITIMLAHLFEQAVGVDSDAAMLAEAERRATTAGISSVIWFKARAEELTPAIGSFRIT